MKIRCPNCSTVMAPKLAPSVMPGVKAQVTCRCGTRCRFTVPGKPKQTEFDRMRSTAFLNDLGMFGVRFPEGRS